MIPVILTVFEVNTEDDGTAVCTVNANGSGVVSHAAVMTSKVLGVPAMVTVVLVVVLQVADAVWRNVSD